MYYTVKDSLTLIHSITGSYHEGLECMGTVGSKPEPGIEQLLMGHSQLWKHRWEHLCSLTSCKGWLLQGKHLYLDTASFGMFHKP